MLKRKLAMTMAAMMITASVAFLSGCSGDEYGGGGQQKQDFA
jgi:hypothetical protein